MSTQTIVASTLIVLVSSSAATAATATPQQPLVCPTRIASSSIQLVNIEPGWTTFIASPLYLHAAAPMYGPPQLRGDIADATERRSKQEWSYTYDLEGSYPDGKWIQCAYGEYNQVTLSKRLPDDTRACTIIYRKGEKAGQHDIKIRCS